jgi:hypothetical protein
MAYRESGGQNPYMHKIFKTEKNCQLNDLVILPPVSTRYDAECSKSWTRHNGKIKNTALTRN